MLNNSKIIWFLFSKLISSESNPSSQSIQPQTLLEISQSSQLLNPIFNNTEYLANLNQQTQYLSDFLRTKALLGNDKIQALSSNYNESFSGPLASISQHSKLKQNKTTSRIKEEPYLAKPEYGLFYENLIRRSQMCTEPLAEDLKISKRSIPSSVNIGHSYFFK